MQSEGHMIRWSATPACMTGRMNTLNLNQPRTIAQAETLLSGTHPSLHHVEKDFMPMNENCHTRLPVNLGH